MTGHTTDILLLLLCWAHDNMLVAQVLQEMLDMLREHESNHHR